MTIELKEIYCPMSTHRPSTDQHVVCSFCYSEMFRQKEALQKRVAQLEEEKEALTDLLIKEHQSNGTTKRS